MSGLVPIVAQIPAGLLDALEPHARARGMTVAKFLVALGAHYAARQPVPVSPDPLPGRVRRKPLSVEYGQALAERVAEGATIKQLALEHRVHTNTMRDHLKHYRIVLPPRREGGKAHEPGAPRVVFTLRGLEQERRWLAYAAAGATYSHLAERFGCTRDEARRLSARLDAPAAPMGKPTRKVLAAVAALDAQYAQEAAA